MKKLFALIMAAMMLFCACTTAFAATASYSSTQAFCNLLDAKGVKYELGGLDSNNNEKLSIHNNDSTNDFSYTIRYFFDDGQENCSLRVWDVISYSDADFAKVLRAVNKLNFDYKYVRFYLDESDNTVTAAIDTIYRTHDIDQILWEATMYVVNILEVAYPILSVYDQ